MHQAIITVTKHYPSHVQDYYADAERRGIFQLLPLVDSLRRIAARGAVHIFHGPNTCSEALLARYDATSTGWTESPAGLYIVAQAE